MSTVKLEITIKVTVDYPRFHYGQGFTSAQIAHELETDCNDVCCNPDLLQDLVFKNHYKATVTPVAEGK